MATRVRGQAGAPRDDRAGIVAPRHLRAAAAAALRFARREPLLTGTSAVLLGLVVVALLGEAIAAHSATEQVLDDRLQGLSWSHPFGTDHLGRDLFARTIVGARTSVIVGLSVMGLGTALALLLGLASGSVGGWCDLLVQRLVDAVMAVPALLFLIALVSVVGAGMVEIVAGISFVVMINSSRTVRGAVIAARAQPYVDAAQALGASRWRVALRHVLPNIVSPVLIVASLNVGYAILMEASLSFLGFGVPPPTPTWGGLIARETRLYMFNAPWLAVFPGLALTTTVLAVNLFGDALRDRLDPRTRRA